MQNSNDKTIEYYGFDLHDTVLLSSSLVRREINVRTTDLGEYFLRSSSDYFKFWFRNSGLFGFIFSLKKYLLLDKNYRLNPQFSALLKRVPADNIFIFSNGINVEWIVKIKFNELKGIKFFFAPTIGFFKPNPKAYSEIAKKLNVSEERILFCGDNYFNDYLAPRLVNMNAVLYRENEPFERVVNCPVNSTGDLSSLI